MISLELGNKFTPCFTSGHPVVLFTGEVKKIEDIKVMDLLLDLDRKPVEVLKVLED